MKAKLETVNIPKARSIHMASGDDSMDVTVVAYRYPPHSPGGAGIYTHRLSNRVRERGHTVRAISAVDDPQLAGKHVVEGIDVETVRVRSKPPFNRINYVYNPGTFFKSFGKGDVAHVHNFGAFSTTVFRALKRQKGHKALLWSCHDPEYMSMRVSETEMDEVVGIGHLGLPPTNMYSRPGWKGRLIWRSLEPNVDRFIAASQFMYSLFLRAGIEEDRCRLVYNGIDASEFEHTPVPEEPIILYVGEITRVKGTDTLIEAMPKVLESVPEASLRIVGTGDLVPTLETQVKRMGLEDAIEFFGFQRDIKSFYRGAKVVALTTLGYEICSLVLLESLASGRPVVASSRGGNQEVIEAGKNGYLFTPGSSDELAEGLIKVLSSEERSRGFGKAARITAETKFSLDRAADETIEVYRELLGA